MKPSNELIKILSNMQRQQELLDEQERIQEELKILNYELKINMKNLQTSVSDYVEDLKKEKTIEIKITER